MGNELSRQESGRPQGEGTSLRRCSLWSSSPHPSEPLGQETPWAAQRCQAGRLGLHPQVASCGCPGSVSWRPGSAGRAGLISQMGAEAVEADPGQLPARAMAGSAACRQSRVSNGIVAAF